MNVVTFCYDHPMVRREFKIQERMFQVSERFGGYQFVLSFQMNKKPKKAGQVLGIKSCPFIGKNNRCYETGPCFMGESLFHQADFHGFLHGFRNVESLKRWSKTNERHGLCPLPMLEAPRKGKRRKTIDRNPAIFVGSMFFFGGVFIFWSFFGVPSFGDVKHVNSWDCVGKCDEFTMEGYFFCWELFFWGGFYMCFCFCFCCF